MVTDREVRVRSDFSTFEFGAFLNLLNQMGEALELEAPCRLEIDLSRPYFFGPGGMVPLISIIDDLVSRGFSVRVAPPVDIGLEAYWDRAGWLAAINGDYPPIPTGRTTYSPLVSYRNHQELNAHLNVVIDILAKVTEFPPGVLRAVEWTINEIADNVLNHAGGAKGWIQVVTRPGKDQIEFVVADRGLGIRSTLQEAFPNKLTDQDALRFAIEQGVTRNRAHGAGNGLAGSIRIAEAAKGWVNILSGCGILRLFPGVGFRDYPTIPFYGTVVTMTLPTKQRIDLRETLWGYLPSSGFEFTHASESGIHFHLSNEATGFGNRGSGEEVATKLRNIMAEFPHDKVILDFEGVDTPSSSFLDEFLAKLVTEQGLTAFFSRVQFQNMNEFVRTATDAVISQRLAHPAED